MLSGRKILSTDLIYEYTLKYLMNDTNVMNDTALNMTSLYASINLGQNLKN